MDNTINQKVLDSLLKIENSLYNSKSILNIDEVSEFTGISKSTLYKLTSNREIPHYKKAKHLIFDRIEIEDWIRSNKICTQEEIESEASDYIAYNKRGGRS